MSSDTTFVSRRNPLIRSPLDIACGIAVPPQIERCSARWRSLKELHERCWLVSALAQLIELLSRHNYNSFAAVFGDALRSFGARKTKELAEARFCLVQLPHAHVGIRICHTLD